MLLLASAGIAEGHASLAETELHGDAARPVLAYAHQAITSGLNQLEAVAKRYVATPECAIGTQARPILSDEKFRAAGLDCALAVEAAGVLGVSGERLAKAVREWIEGNDPTKARAVAMAADAACRMSKMRAARAA
jgi:hypothetical protein